MTEKLELYKCETCGNIVQVIISGYGQLVCCDKNMDLMQAKTSKEEMLGEKHVPVFESTNEGGTEIKIGSVPHPMVSEHYIMFIEAISEDRNHVKLQYLYPGEEPKMTLAKKMGKTMAKEYCNIHGLWEAQSD